MERLKANLSKIRQFCKKYELDLFILFGSSVSDRTHPRSDVDIAVVPHQPRSGLDKLELIGILCDLYQTDRIDLVIISPETDPLLLLEIFSKGKVLYESKPDLFRRHYLRAWHLYQDTEAIRKAEERYLREYARNLKRHVA